MGLERQGQLQEMTQRNTAPCEPLAIRARWGHHGSPWWGLIEGKSDPTWLEEFGDSVILPGSPFSSEEKNIRKISGRAPRMRRLIPLRRRGGGTGARAQAPASAKFWVPGPGPPLHLYFLICKVGRTVTVYIWMSTDDMS